MNDYGKFVGSFDHLLSGLHQTRLMQHNSVRRRLIVNSADQPRNVPRITDDKVIRELLLYWSIRTLM